MLVHGNTKMPEIFINYRRNDSSGYTGRITDQLRNCFGAEQIFRDHETLDSGVRFKQEIQDSILSSSIILVIIGREWLAIEKKTGKLRLNLEDDFVRFEIEKALAYGIPIIPVLVGGAQMPSLDILPKEIKKIAELNAHHLTETHWDADIAELIRILASKTGLDDISQSKEHSISAHWSSSLLPVVYVIPDFLSLIRHPKQFLRKRSFGRPKDLLNALVFFTLIVLIAEIYLSITWQSENYSFWGFVFLGIPFWFLITLLISVPLWLSWWFVGARDHYQRIIVILFYQMAVVIIIFFIAGIIVVTGLTFRNPDVMQTGFQILKNPDELDKYQHVSNIFSEAMVGIPAFITLGLGLGILSILPLWLISAWGGYREALHRTRWASCLAFPIFSIVLISPLVLFAWLGSVT